MVIDNIVTGPAAPVATNVTVLATPVTVAVTWFAPATVPSVHVALASPVASVIDTRGTIVPLPIVTMKPTDAPATAFSDASVTLTVTAFVIVVPT